MPDQAIYRCINEACARTMPRRVAFCPYCGTAQTASARAQAAAQAGPQAATESTTQAATQQAPDEGARRAAPADIGAQAARPAGWSDAPSGDGVKPQAVANAAPPSATAFGHGARAAGGAASTPGAAGAAGDATTTARTRGIPWPPKPAAPSGPGGRSPIRLRWWLLALVVLWGVWLYAKPSARKTERRIDAAIALAQACKAKPAQDELIALRAAHASAAQLERLQRGLNEAAGACTRKRQRDKAWDEASAAVESLLAAGGYERARTRLQAFTRRWGEDAQTRALKQRIDDGLHPLAAPSSDS